MYHSQYIVNTIFQTELIFSKLIAIIEKIVPFFSILYLLATSMKRIKEYYIIYYMRRIYMKKKVLVVNRLEKEALEELQQEKDTTVFIDDESLEKPTFVDAINHTEVINGLMIPVNTVVLIVVAHLKIVSNVAFRHMIFY